MNEKTKEILMSEIYRKYAEIQNLINLERGYAMYRGISVDKFCNQLVKANKSADESWSYLIKDLNIEMLKPFVEEICNKLCSESDGWVHIIKNGESIYYHPDYVSGIDIPEMVTVPEHWFDPKTMAYKVLFELVKIDKLYKTGKAIETRSWERPFNLYLNGNFVTACCVSHKVKF